MSATAGNLSQKAERLRKEISNNLDFLIGSVTTQGVRGGFSLTTADKGKTRTKYIRAGMLEEVQTRIDRHRKLKALIKELSEVNWALLKAKDPR
jgi:hypothetical protein